MGSPEIFFGVVFFFLGLSDTGLFGLSCCSSCVISFWSCLISLSSCVSCWSSVFRGGVMCLCFLVG